MTGLTLGSGTVTRTVAWRKPVEQLSPTPFVYPTGHTAAVSLVPVWRLACALGHAFASRRPLAAQDPGVVPAHTLHAEVRVPHHLDKPLRKDATGIFFVVNGIWSAHWRAAPDRIAPASATGTAAQEVWHGANLKQMINCKHTPHGLARASVFFASMLGNEALASMRTLLVYILG